MTVISQENRVSKVIGDPQRVRGAQASRPSSTTLGQIAGAPNKVFLATALAAPPPTPTQAHPDQARRKEYSPDEGPCGPLETQQRVSYAQWLAWKVVRGCSRRSLIGTRVLRLSTDEGNDEH